MWVIIVLRFFKNVNSVNLFIDVNAKTKKPTSYATQLLSILLTEQKMINGCVEPRDPGKKLFLDQGKIGIIKSKYSEVKINPTRS